jgi:hypothetical protein
VGKPEGKKQQRDSTLRSEDDIKIDFREIGLGGID